MSMAEAIEKRLGHTKREKIHVLVLDGFRFRGVDETAAKELENLVNLQLFAANRTLLSDLSGFPPMKSLETLEIQDSALTDDCNLEHVVRMAPKLKSLYLSNNHIQRLETFSCLKELESLSKLEVEMNPCANFDYKKVLFEMLPQVQIIDEHDRMGNVVESSGDEESDESEGALESAPGELLKQFYNEDLTDSDDEEEEDFDPVAMAEEDDEDEDDDLDDEEGTDDEPPDGSLPESSGVTRDSAGVAEQASEPGESETKKPRLE